MISSLVGIVDGWYDIDFNFLSKLFLWVGRKSGGRDETTFKMSIKLFTNNSKNV